MAVRSNSCVIRIAGTIAAVALVSFSPARASAQCGDYITIADGRHAPVQPHGLTDPVTGRRLPPKPCNGPNCSGGPAQPEFPLTAPPPPPDDSRQSAAGAVGNPGGGRGPGWFAGVTSHGPPIHVARSIFRPPRTA